MVRRILIMLIHAGSYYRFGERMRSVASLKRTFFEANISRGKSMIKNKRTIEKDTANTNL